MFLFLLCIAPIPLSLFSIYKNVISFSVCIYYLLIYFLVDIPFLEELYLSFIVYPLLLILSIDIEE